MKKQTYQPSFSEELIADLKRKHGRVFAFKVGQQEYIFKKPSIAAVSAAMSIAKNNPVKSWEVIYKDTLVHGDKNLAEDPDFICSVGPFLNTLVEIVQVEIKEL
jgi:hypothetical protein